MRGQTEIRRDALAVGVLVLAVAAAYLPAFSAGFVFDDHAVIEGNRLLRGPIWRLWIDASAPDYWPLTWSALWLQWRAFGDHAAGYHAVNLALHAVVAVLLWRVLRKLEVPGAWLAGLLFAVHPVAVESVAWVSEQKNTVSAIFFLATILVWASPERRARDRLAALALFALAALAKASVVMLPVVLLGISAHRRGRLERRDVVEVAPFFAVALALGLVNVWFQHRNAMVGWSTSRGLAERVGGAGWALASYLETAFVPVRAAIVYPPVRADPGSALYFLPLVAIVAAFAALWALRGRSGAARAALAALGYHALMLLPVLGLLDMAYLRIAPIANHLQYLALMGPVALAAAAVTWCARRFPVPARAAAAALAIALAALTSTRASAYESDLALWERAVAETPRSAFAREQLSMLLLREGRIPEALHQLAEVAALARGPADRHRARALLAFHAGQAREAAAEAREVLPLTADPELRRDAAWVLTQTGASDEAIDVLAELVRRAPSSPDYAYWLGAALSRSGRLEEAAGVLGAWCRERPGDPKMEEALSFVLAKLGRERAQPR